jgi:hypothetical protein
MITKVSAMNSVTMETECRRMADSCLDFEMTGRNLGILEKRGIAEYNSKRRLTGTFRPSYSGVEDGRLCDGLLF